MKAHIQIDTKTFVRFLVVVTAFVISLYLIYLTRYAIGTVLIAFFFALALNPPVSRLAKLMPGNSRIGATLIAYLAVVALLGLFVFTVIPPVIEQSARFAEKIPAAIENVGNQSELVASYVDRYNLREQYNQAISNAQGQADDFAKSLGSFLVTGVGSLINALIQTVLVLVLAFLMLVEGPTWLSRLWKLYSNKVKLAHHQRVANKMYRVVTGYVNGQILVTSISAVSATVVVLVLSGLFNLPTNLALPIGAIIFLAGLVPMFGAIIGGIIASILLALNDFTAGLVFATYFIIYQQIENNFISPVIQSKTVELSALSILVGFTIGLTLFGPIGGLISIPITGAIRVIFLDYLEHKHAYDEPSKKDKLLNKLKKAEK